MFDGMGTRMHLLVLADTYAEYKKLALATVSRYATGQARTFDRIRAGADITTGRAERTIRWFAVNWPSELLWPPEVPRPEVTEQ